jgi:sugar lactone lactonase YvrE
VRTEHLRDVTMSSEKLAGLVEEYAAKPLCAGITLDGKGNIYVSDLAAKAIGMISAGSREYRILATDPRFLWPDGLCFGADGKLYFFTNATRAVPRASRSSLPAAADAHTNYLFRLQTPASGRVGD